MKTNKIFDKIIRESTIDDPETMTPQEWRAVLKIYGYLDKACDLALNLGGQTSGGSIFDTIGESIDELAGNLEQMCEEAKDARYQNFPTPEWDMIHNTQR